MSETLDDGGRKRAAPDAGDPVVLVFGSGGRHAVDGVLALDDFALRVRLARLDEVVAARGVQLETVGLVPVVDLADLAPSIFFKKEPTFI